MANEGDGFDAGAAVRAIRRRLQLSQRELAERAGIGHRTLAAIESGRRNPGIAVVARIAAATGLRLAIVDDDGTELRPDRVHDAIRDRGGRHFPAHLSWEADPQYLTLGREWWGWDHLRWESTDAARIPEHVYWHRPRPPRAGEWREHPWYGMYQSRETQSRETQSREGQSRGPSDGPPDDPPACPPPRSRRRR